MPHDSRNPEKKKNKSAAQKQNPSHGSVGETSRPLGSLAGEPVPPIEGDVMNETHLTPQEICEMADMLEIKVVTTSILEKLQAAESRRRNHPLPGGWQSAESSLRAQAVANLSEILRLLKVEHDGESSERLEKLPPGAMKQSDQTTPRKEDPPQPGQVPFHFHIYPSALLPEPYMAHGWHHVPVIQHEAPPPAGGNQSVPIQQHGEPTPAGGCQSVPVQQHGNTTQHMPTPYVIYPYRPGHPQYNQLPETSEPQHGSDGRQQDSQANNPSQNNSPSRSSRK